jgi:hypothetical protein
VKSDLTAQDYTWNPSFVLSMLVKVGLVLSSGVKSNLTA